MDSAFDPHESAGKPEPQEPAAPPASTHRDAPHPDPMEMCAPEREAASPSPVEGATDAEPSRVPRAALDLVATEESPVSISLDTVCAAPFGVVVGFEMPATGDAELEALVEEVAEAFDLTRLETTMVLLASASALVAGGVTVEYGRVRAVPIHAVLVDGGHGIAPLVAGLRDLARHAREAAHRAELGAYHQEDARHRADLETLRPGDPYPGGPPQRPQPWPPAILVSPEAPALAKALGRLAEDGGLLGYTPHGAPGINAGLGAGRPPALLAAIEAAECRAVTARISSIGHTSRRAVLRWASGAIPEEERRPSEDRPPVGTILVDAGNGRGRSAAAVPKRLADAAAALAILRTPVRLSVEDGQLVREQVEITAHDIGRRTDHLASAVAPGVPTPAFMGLIEQLDDRLWAIAAAMHLWNVALTGDRRGDVVSSKTVERAAILSRALASHEWDLLRPAALPRNLREARAVWEALGRLPDPTSLDCVGAEVREIPRSAVRVAIDALEDAGLVERVIRGEEERKRGAVPILVRRARHMT